MWQEKILKIWLSEICYHQFLANFQDFWPRLQRNAIAKHFRNTLGLDCELQFCVDIFTQFHLVRLHSSRATLQHSLRFRGTDFIGRILPETFWTIDGGGFERKMAVTITRRTSNWIAEVLRRSWAQNHMTQT